MSRGHAKEDAISFTQVAPQLGRWLPRPPLTRFRADDTIRAYNCQKQEEPRRTKHAKTGLGDVVRHRCDHVSEQEGAKPRIVTKGADRPEIALAKNNSNQSHADPA